jgi:hypothetical protein
MKPITPDEAETKRADKIPAIVIEAVNNLIQEKWDGYSAKFCDVDIAREIDALATKRNIDVTILGLPNVAPIYEKFEWSVKCLRAIATRHDGACMVLDCQYEFMRGN